MRPLAVVSSRREAEYLATYFAGAAGLGIGGHGGSREAICLAAASDLRRGRRR